MNDTLHLLSQQPNGRIRHNLLHPRQRSEIIDAINIGAAKRVMITPFDYVYQITPKGRTLVKPGLLDESPKNPYLQYTVAELTRLRKTMLRELKLIEELI